MSLDVRFHITRSDFTLDVDVRMPTQGTTALFGPSGCGKTTLLRAIAGLDRHVGGSLSFDESVWQNDRRFVPPHERNVGYVFQEASLFPHLTVRRNLEYGLRRVPIDEQRVSLEQVISMLGIQNLLDRKPVGLSGGERQRVAIARALAVSPQILLMDEPLAGLESARKQEVLPYIDSLHRDLEIPVIYVSHLPDEVARLADHLVLLDDGRILGSGPIGDMLTRLDLPLALRDDAEAVIEATVTGHDEEFGLTNLEFDGIGLTVPGSRLPSGSLVRLRIAARDVSLTLEHQTGTSILNIVPATVEEIRPKGKSQVIVRLALGGATLLARVTRRSSSILDLRPDRRVFAQIKSVAVLS